MIHISEDKLDLYILNKNLLGNELDIIESHFAKCSLCKKKLVEMSEYYNTLKEIANEKAHRGKSIGITDIQEKLRKHRTFNLDEIKELFKFPLEKTGRRNLLFLKFSSLFNNISFYFQNRKLVLGLITITLLAFLSLISIFLLDSYKTKQIALKPEKNTTLPDTLFAKVETPEDTIIKENNQLEKSKTFKRKSSNFFATIISSPSIVGTRSKGEIQYYFVEGTEFFTIKFFHKKLKSSALIIVNDVLNKEEITIQDIDNYYHNKKLKYLIIFPKTKINTNKNSICDVIQSDFGIDVIISENENKCDFNKDPLIIYKFSKNIEVLDVEFSSGFRKKYSEFLGYNVSQTDLDSLKSELENNIKSWDGKKITNGINEIKKFKTP